MSKPYVKFERNRRIRGRVIYDLAHFRRHIFDWGPNPRIDLRGVWTELHQTCRGHRGIMAELRIVSDFRYLAAFSKAGRSKSSYVENDAKFRTF